MLATLGSCARDEMGALVDGVFCGVLVKGACQSRMALALCVKVMHGVNSPLSLTEHQPDPASCFGWAQT